MVAIHHNARRFKSFLFLHVTFNWILSFTFILYQESIDWLGSIWIFGLLFVLNILVTDFSSLNFKGNVLILEPWLIKMEQNYFRVVTFSLSLVEHVFIFG
jgi:hypothetical protein